SLPEPRTILELLHNEIARTSPSHSVALAANTRGPPPGPCPACCQTPVHWMDECKFPDLVKQYRERQDARRKRCFAPNAKFATSAPSPPPDSPTANLADLLTSIEGVEAWLAGTLPSKPTQLTLDSGSTHPMCGDRSKFFDFQSCHPSAVGGISSTSLKVLGVGSLSLRLSNGHLVSISKVLYVPGISTTLISASKLYDLHGITSVFGEGAILKHGNEVLATGSRVRGSLYS
ncbi:uncharacterized protein JCM6883_004817, partial [Sporobolomyces salmoneus]|uniref:uncharacterized protein n=1 Tax=Sporobolomyces salmoneus TaxID=183962 RepID=UPI00317DF424